jgi:hypothetical protein
MEREHFKEKNVMSSTSSSGKCIGSLGNSELTLYNKIILYKQVIRPVWSYGIKLWCWVCDSNIVVIPRYQTKC